MKKNITVNFFGSLYAIDEDAYELLKSYMDSLHDYFGRREGGEEIVNDLEARIAELLEELKRSGVQAVEISHVEQIIRRLGNPEEMAAEGGETDGGGEEKAESPRPEGTARKRLFRNPDDRMLGGVLSGVACYFGGDPLLWRLAMVAFFLLSGGTALLVYVVLWIVVPLARTPEEQLLMRGRPVTAGSLGEAVTAQARRAGQGGTRTEPAAPQGGTYGFFNGLLKMLHPFMPFITEELWQHIYDRKPGESIMLDKLAIPSPDDEDNAITNEIEIVKQIISNVRMVRNQKNISPKEKLKLQAININNYAQYNDILVKMANLEGVENVAEKSPDTVQFMVGTDEYAIPIGSLIDINAEIEKQEAQLKHLEGFLAGVMKKLSNERFVANAPEAVVALERKKQSDSEEKIKALRTSLAELKSKLK